MPMRARLRYTTYADTPTPPPEQIKGRCDAPVPPRCHTFNPPVPQLAFLFISPIPSDAPLQRPPRSHNQTLASSFFPYLMNMFSILVLFSFLFCDDHTTRQR